MLEYVIVTVCAADVEPTAVRGNGDIVDAEMDVCRVSLTLLIVFFSVPDVPLNVNFVTILPLKLCEGLEPVELLRIVALVPSEYVAVTSTPPSAAPDAEYVNVNNPAGRAGMLVKFFSFLCDKPFITSYEPPSLKITQSAQMLVVAMKIATRVRIYRRNCFTSINI